MIERDRLAVVVLAAGASTRFGSAKLAASLDGRPLLEHVLELAAGLGAAHTIVVLPPDDAPLAPVLAGADPTLRRVVNPRPQDGLSSSVRIGLAAVPPRADAALVLLGDQPRTRLDVVESLLAVDVPPDRLIVVPDYEADGGSNPALLLRPAFAAVAELDGDRGFGPYIARHPDRVLRVPVAGRNPDVDTPADLALLAWADRVRANRDQAEAVREEQEADFYAPVSALFRVPPDRSGDAVLDALLGHARPQERWLDIGGGAGRYALPLARRVAEVVVVDPSVAMLEALAESRADARITNVRAVHGRWPVTRADWPADVPWGADAALIANVGYDIEDIGPFLDAMEAAANRLCVAILAERSPAVAAEPFWPLIHGQERVRLPAAPEFVAMLEIRGRRPEVVRRAQTARAYSSREQLLRWTRQQLFVAAHSRAARRLEAVADEAMTEVDGGFRYRHHEPFRTWLVSWSPR